jgi:hypothetical protein
MGIQSKSLINIVIIFLFLGSCVNKKITRLDIIEDPFLIAQSEIKRHTSQPIILMYHLFKERKGKTAVERQTFVFLKTDPG